MHIYLPFPFIFAPPLIIYHTFSVIFVCCTAEAPLFTAVYWCDSQFLWPTYQNLRPVARVISSGQASKGDTYTEAMYALL